MLTVTDVLCDTDIVSNGFKLSSLQDAAWQGLEVHDTVHGTFHLSPLCSLAEGTTPVQRLRHLKQLGSTYLGPFPSAVHTRHEHSLGTAHLAGRCMLQLADSEQDIRAVDVELTALAGKVRLL
jgi:HD superfamily phosphohydrolase